MLRMARPLNTYIHQKMEIDIERSRIGRSVKSLLITSSCTAGIMDLLDELKVYAQQRGACPIDARCDLGVSLAALISPKLRVALNYCGSHVDFVKYALRILHGFEKAHGIPFDDFNSNEQDKSEPGMADSGFLENDLIELLSLVGSTAQKVGVVLVFFLENIDCLEQRELAALLAALHRCNQLNLPVLLVGSGQPRLRSIVGNSKPYAERLFDFVMI